jgi:flagellar biosynthetic protein FliR
MDFSFEQLEGWVRMAVWPFCRIAALVMTLSVFGTRTMPARIRLLLALAITVCVVPVLPAMPSVPIFSLQSYFIIAQEMMIGIVIGFATRLLMDIFVVAGQLISLQTGLGFASLVDPVNGASVPLIGQLLLMSAMLLFFLMDGHLVAIETVVRSFDTLPVALDSIGKIDFLRMANWGQWLFASALMVAIASVLALLMLNVAFGVLTRAAPQMNLFTIGFPATMLIGLLLMWLLLADLPLHFENELQRAQQFSCELVGLRC